MSGNYRTICLNHNPALILLDAEWGSPEGAADALAAVLDRDPDGYLSDHAACDLLIGRWSGGLIQLCCPRRDMHGWMHRDPEWVEVGWLRLAHAALLAGVHLEPKYRIPACWTDDRIRRLAPLLEV